MHNWGDKLTPNFAAIKSCISRSSDPWLRLRPCVRRDDWIHEPKWDAFRFQIIKDGAGVRFYSRHGAEYTERLPQMVEAFAKLPRNPQSSTASFA